MHHYNLLDTADLAFNFLIFEATKETDSESSVGHVPQPLGIYSGPRSPLVPAEWIDWLRGV